MKKYHLVIFIAVGAILLALASVFGADKADVEKANKKDLSDTYKEIELFADAFSILKYSYVQPVSAKDLIRGALKGMLDSLDDYSQYLEPDNFDELKEDTKGQFGGIGIEVGVRGGVLTVISPIDGTPAKEAGLMPNDVIVKIDGEITRDLTTHDAVKKLRGKPGTTVNMTLWRDKENRFFDVVIKREIISVKSIKKYDILAGDIGYIKLVEFQESSASEIEEAMKLFSKKNIKGVILDLRFNAGGLLNSAIAVSEIFLPKGTLIVSTKARIESQNKEYRAAKDSPYSDIVLAVLVNEGSASASEIVAGAMKDNGRGILVGQKTFGKGSVQTVLPMRDGSALRITTAEYFTPKGISIHKQGIMPDIDALRESDSELNAEKNKAEDVFEKLEEKKPNKEEEKKIKIDNQMKTAIDIIKALYLYKEKEGGKN